MTAADEARLQAELDCDWEDLPPVPADEYRLDDYRCETAIGPQGNVWIHADRSVFAATVEGEGVDTELHLFLGDMAYHSIPLWRVLLDGARVTAETYDETGAADDIEQLLLAASRLLGARS